jgi:hypothetical protein
VVRTGNTFQWSQYKISIKMNINGTDVCKNAKNTICKLCVLYLQWDTPFQHYFHFLTPAALLCVMQAVTQTVPVTGVQNAVGKVHDNSCCQDAELQDSNGHFHYVPLTLSVPISTMTLQVGFRKLYATQKWLLIPTS